MAAGHTAPGRPPHSVHTYFLRPGDARRPVDFEVVELQEGRTFSARRVTARQDGTGAAGGDVVVQAAGRPSSRFEYQPPMPAVPEPESLPYVRTAFRGIRGSDAGPVVQPALVRAADRRRRPDLPPARSRIWWRPDGEVPDDPMLHACLVAYLSAVTLTEPAFAARPAVGRVGAAGPLGVVPRTRRSRATGCCTTSRRRAARTAWRSRRAPCSTATATWCARSSRRCTFRRRGFDGGRSGNSVFHGAVEAWPAEHEGADMATSATLDHRRDRRSADRRGC